MRRCSLRTAASAFALILSWPALTGCDHGVTALKGYKAVRNLRVGRAVPARRAPGPSLVLGTSLSGGVVTVSVPDGRRRTVLRLRGRNAHKRLQAAAWAPDGRSFVASAGYQDGWVILAPLGSRRRTTIHAPVFVPAASSIAFSPDGRYLVVSGHDERAGLYAYDLRGRRKLRLLKGDAGPMSWSPDGRRIVFDAERVVAPNGALRTGPGSFDGDKVVGGIAVLDLTTGAVRLLSPEGTDPAFSPDGKHIAFVSRRGGIGKQCSEDGCDVNEEINIMRADGTHRHRITHTTADERTPAWSPDGRYLVAQAATRNAWDELDALITLRADGSCYRILTPPSDDEISLGANAWRPAHGVAGGEPRC